MSASLLFQMIRLQQRNPVQVVVALDCIDLHIATTLLECKRAQMQASLTRAARSAPLKPWQ